MTERDIEALGLVLQDFLLRDRPRQGVGQHPPREYAESEEAAKRAAVQLVAGFLRDANRIAAALEFMCEEMRRPRQ